MYITRVLIGRNPCLDQAIQTRKTIVLLLFYKTITLWFPCLDGLIQTLGNVAVELRKASKITRSLAFLNSRNIPRVFGSGHPNTETIK